MKTKFLGILEKIGLSKNEALILEDLIENGESTALEISKRTKIYRSNTYDSIRRLIERGFVSELILDNKKIFKAMGPEKIKNYISEQLREFESILPFLSNLSLKDGQKEEITISKGAFALKEAVRDLLKSGEPILVYGASRENVTFMGEPFLKEFHKDRMKKKILMRHIYSQENIERINRLNKLKFTEARYLNKKYDANICTTICDDTVLFYTYGKPLTVIKIVNRNISDAYKKYFELLWKESKKE